MKNKLILNYPASWWGAKWRDALPSGNGMIGAAVYGAVHDETVLLTHDDLWHEVATPQMPDVSARLPEVRRLLLENKAVQANTILSDALKEAGYNADIGAPLPLADLKIRMPIERGFAHYRRSLDMATGEVSVTWQDNDVSYARKLFVSRADDSVVMEITSKGGPLTVNVALDLHDRADAKLGKQDDPKLPKDVTVETDGKGIIRYAARNDDGTDFGAVVRVRLAEGTLTASEGSLHIEGAEQVLIVLKVFIKGNRLHDWVRLQSELDANPSRYVSLGCCTSASHP